MKKQGMLLVSKRGSYTIFITLIFMGILIFVNAVIWASIRDAVDSGTEYSGRLFGQSIIAEYDNYLHDRYQLFAFYGDYFETKNKLEYYIKNTTSRNKYAKFKETNVDLDDYHITDTDTLLKEIKRAVIYDIDPVPFYRELETDSATTSVNRYVSARWIIDELPSKSEKTYLNVNSVISSLSNESFIETPLIDRYITKFFKNHIDDKELGETYFNNEIEYIISGKLNDNKAYGEVRNKLLMIRSGLNTKYLYSDNEKKEAAMAIGTIIFPELSPIVAQAIIIESWASLEAENDLRILEDGKEVPFSKTDENFALSLMNVICQEYGTEYATNLDNEKVSSKKGYVKPKIIEGQNYESYLKVLLTFEPEKTKLFRIMDLIQLNGKYLYADYFNINEYYVGLKYDITINNRKHEFEESYFK